jgi:hypothetical protein
VQYGTTLDFGDRTGRFFSLGASPGGVYPINGYISESLIFGARPSAGDNTLINSSQYDYFG